MGAELDLDSLPVSPWLRRIPADQRLHAMLHGGEDYELLFTAGPQTRIPSRLGGVRITHIGTMTRRPRSGPAVVAVSPAGRESIEPRGWEHLK